MELDMILDMLGEGVVRSGKNGNRFRLTRKLSSTYEEFSVSKTEMLGRGPLDLYALASGGMISFGGESKFSPSAVRLRLALGYGNNQAIRMMTNWDGGITTREIIDHVISVILDQIGRVLEGSVDLFDPFDWVSIYEYIIAEYHTPKTLKKLKQRKESGLIDAQPDDRLPLSGGGMGATVAEFIAYLGVKSMQDKFMLDLDVIDKDKYYQKLSRYVVAPVYDKLSTKSDEDAIVNEPNTGDTDISGHRGSYDRG
jgi:hypothetical protein